MSDSLFSPPSPASLQFCPSAPLCAGLRNPPWSLFDLSLGVIPFHNRHYFYISSLILLDQNKKVLPHKVLE